MWKKVDNKTYKRLYSMKNKGFVPSVGILSLIFLTIPIMIAPVDFGGGLYSPIHVATVFSMLGLSLLFLILKIVFYFKERKIMYRLASGNNAAYTSAELILKDGSTKTQTSPDSGKNLFSVAVQIDGRKLSVSASRDAFTHKDIGDRVCLVDLLGEKAKNPHTCIALTQEELDPERQ